MYTQQDWQEADNLQHWCPKSQAFAPAAVLLQHIGAGWKLDEAINVVRRPLGSHRHVDVYHFELYHRDDHMEMPVIANPVVLKLVNEYHLMVTKTDIRCDLGMPKPENGASNCRLNPKRSVRLLG